MFKDKGLRNFVIFILFFLSFYLLYLVINPLWGDIKKLREESELISNDIKVLEISLREREGLDKELMFIENEALAGEKLIPREGNLNEVLAELERIFDESELSIKSFNSGKIQRSEENNLGFISFNVIAEEKADHDELFLSFLREIESFPYLIVTESFRYHRGEKEAQNTGHAGIIAVVPETISRISLSCKLYVKID